MIRNLLNRLVKNAGIPVTNHASHAMDSPPKQTADDFLVSNRSLFETVILKTEFDGTKKVALISLQPDAKFIGTNLGGRKTFLSPEAE